MHNFWIEAPFLLRLSTALAVLGLATIAGTALYHLLNVAERLIRTFATRPSAVVTPRMAVTPAPKKPFQEGLTQTPQKVVDSAA